VKLPFGHSTWPVLKEEKEERIVNPSYDTQLQEHLIEEIVKALEERDHKGLHEALSALIENILSEDDHAIDEGEKSKGV
jgi:hypothetical protein